jgi:hypothetical protein
MCVSAVVLADCDAGGTVSPSSAPTIVTLQPSAGPVGTRVTIMGTGFHDNANTINFGPSAYPNVVGQNGTSIIFSIPVASNPPCRNATPPCAIASTLITPGAYALSVTNSAGESRTEMSEAQSRFHLRRWIPHHLV